MRVQAGLVLAMGLAGASCGGGMKHQVNDRVLGDVSMQQKGGMLDARGEMDRVAEERNHAQADLAAADRDIALAEDGYKQAKLEIDKGQANLALEQRGKNIGPSQSAEDQIGLARLGADAARTRVEWFKRRHDVRQAQLDLAEAHGKLASARYEQQKALLARRMDKQPTAGFKVGDYDRQVFDMEHRYREAQDRVEKHRLDAAQMEERYGQMVEQYDRRLDRYTGPRPAYAPPPLPRDRDQAATPAPGRI